MGIQLIFVVETNKKCKSDWIYIKDTIDTFYKYDNAHVKLSPLYMSGKNRYTYMNKEISTQINKYSGTSKVIYCFDCDEYDRKAEDRAFLDEVKKYCKDNGYDFVWFCKDIEQVYLGRKVSDSNKKKEAATFKAKKSIKKVNPASLEKTSYTKNTSNLLRVLDQYLERK